MITTARTSAARLAVEDTIDDALRRLTRRAERLGEPAASLAAAAARAARGGKRFRPALVVASFETLGGSATETPGLSSIAAAFELLHAAFVVHDDVIDHDTHRRGTLNVIGEFRGRGLTRGTDAAGSALLGDAAGILAGDLLLAEAFRTITLAEVSDAVRAELVEVIDDAVMVSIAGELADVEHSVVAEAAAADAVLGATRDKTATYSFSAPLQAGAILAGADAESRAALGRFGERLGLAFQLVDDLIGAFGSSEQAGRGEGGDLREAKQTPLIALARQSEQWPDINRALAQAHTGPVAIRAAQRALAASGARAQLEQLVSETLASARSIATTSSLPDATRAMLLELVDAVEERIP